MITFENFEKILTEIGAEPIKDKDGFYRSFKLNANNNMVTLIWFKNKCSADIGNDIHIVDYDDITVNGFFPNKYKLNLNLLKDGEIVAVIPLK